MTYTIYLLFGLLLGFLIGLVAGYATARKTIDESIKKAWIALIANAPKVGTNKKDEGKK